MLRWVLWKISHETCLHYWTETPGSNKDIPQMGTLAVLAIKQEPQGLLMPAQAAVQIQKEVSVVVERS